MQTTDDDVKHILILKKKETSLEKVHTKMLTKVTYGIMGNIFSFYLALKEIEQTFLCGFPIFQYQHSQRMIILNPTYIFESPGRLKDVRFLGPMPRDSE